MPWYSGLAARVQPDAPLAELTWYRLGGPARWLVTPSDDSELAAVLQRCTRHDIPWRILGRGANVLVSDAGFNGAVIRLVGPLWESVHIENATVTAAAGADFPRLVQQTVDTGLAGLAVLAGIPGTLGGIIRMNAGGKYGKISDVVQRVELMTPDGARVTVPAAEMNFSYRHSAVGNRIILNATLTLRPTNHDEVRTRFRQIWKEKAAAQPAVAARSAGCIFKNPPHDAAGRLLDTAGLKGHRIGGAEISPRHANFILAHPDATAADVLNLIQHARERVRTKHGIELELEIDLW